jgi:glyoxylate/hydroxypyruvate reductase A
VECGVHKVLIVSDDAEAYREIIEAAEPELEARAYTDAQAAGAFAREAEILFTWKFPPELLGAMDRLRWIQSTGAGVDHVMAAQPIPPGVVVTRLVDVYGTAMSEYVLAYLYVICQRVRQILDQQRERRWRPFAPAVLSGQTAVVVGLGKIGQEVSRALRVVGLHVLGVSRLGRPVAGPDEVLPVEQLDSALPRADFLVLVVPLTAESRHLIDARRLALLPPRAWLVNIGRGALVPEDALIGALRRGSLAGAVLDVFEREPLPMDSPLWGMENVIVTPHIAGPDEIAVNAAKFLENYGRFKAGQPLEGVVDLERGY